MKSAHKFRIGESKTVGNRRLIRHSSPMHFKLFLLEEKDQNGRFVPKKLFRYDEKDGLKNVTKEAIIYGSIHERIKENWQGW